MINNSISVKISRLQNGRFFSQKLVLHGEKRQRDRGLYEPERDAA